MITGIARIFQQGVKARERSDRAGEGCGTTVGRFLIICATKRHFLHIKRLIRPQFFNFCLVSPINGGGGGGEGAWALVPPYSYASDSGVARIC